MFELRVNEWVGVSRKREEVRDVGSRREYGGLWIWEDFGRLVWRGGEESMVLDDVWERSSSWVI